MVTNKSVESTGRLLELIIIMMDYCFMDISSGFRSFSAPIIIPMSHVLNFNFRFTLISITYFQIYTFVVYFQF